MSRLFVPVSGRADIDHEKVLCDLKKMGAQRVYIALEERFPFERGEHRDALLSSIKSVIDFYTSHGIDASMWIDTLGFGGPHEPYNEEIAKTYTPIENIFGQKENDAFCPLDEKFVTMLCDYIEELCQKTGLRSLMLDDELCLSARHGIGCACPLHIAEYRRRLGEDISQDLIGKMAFCGAPNRYRDIWFELMSDTLKDFCKKIRAAVDRVDPTIRLGFCAGYTSWDLEGADAIELTNILAGTNKPFLRFTGAPYWYANGRFKDMSLQTIIETARLQFAACKGSGIEVFGEADTYPRNRFHVPASYSELFDLACRVSDDMDMLKYMYTYSCPDNFEGGYVKTQIRNLALYDEIRSTFAAKQAVGIRAYDKIKKIQNADLPSPEVFTYDDGRRVNRLSFPLSQTILSTNAIPSVYEGTGICGIAFGESAKNIPESAFKNGLILDTKAALILAQKGIDTGIVKAERIACDFREKFEDGTIYHIYDSAYVYRLILNERAKIKSTFIPRRMFEQTEIPASYTYENAAGQRFLVFAFSAEELRENSTLLRSYERGREIADTAEWLGGSPLPVRCDGHPMLYSLVKEGGGKLAAAYFNCHADEIFDAKIELAKPARSVRFINCSGKQTDEKTIIIDVIRAYGFAAIEVE